LGRLCIISGSRRRHGLLGKMAFSEDDKILIKMYQKIQLYDALVIVEVVQCALLTLMELFYNSLLITFGTLIEFFLVPYCLFSF